MTTTTADGGRGRAPVYASIALLAALSWGVLLLSPNALFWDDWVVVNNDTTEWAREMGLPWIAPVIIGLLALGPWTFKVIAILGTVIVGWTSYEIAGRGFGLATGERWMLAALVVTLPLNATRGIVILGTYSWSITLFFIAWFLLVWKSPSAAGRIRYVAAAVLLFASYTTASLLPFTLLPAAHLAFLSISRDAGFLSGLWRFVRNFWWLALAPVLFWIVRTLFFQPYGLYADYNKVTLGLDLVGIAALALLLVTLVTVALVGYLLGCAWRNRPPHRATLLVLGLITAGMAAFVYVTRVSPAPVALVIPFMLGASAIVVVVLGIARITRSLASRNDAQRVELVLALGLLAFMLAIVPYLLVGKLPSFENWETRHQVLESLGFATILVATARAARALVRPAVVTAVAAAIIAISAATSAYVGLALVADSQKQAQLTAALAQEPLVQQASTVVFSDLATQFNYDRRPLGFNEYSGWLARAFGDHTRLGINDFKVPMLLNGEFDGALAAADRYGFGDYVPSTDGVLVEIRPAEGATWWGLLTGAPSIELTVLPIDDLSSIG